MGGALSHRWDHEYYRYAVGDMGLYSSKSKSCTNVKGI
jgi:hypothetical protein